MKFNGLHLPIEYAYGKPPENSEDTFYWRAVDKSYSVTIDPEREVYGSKLVIELTYHPVVKRTPCGVKLAEFPKWVGGSQVFVSDSSIKKWAYPTELEALEGLLQVRQWQRRILQAQLSANTNVIGTLQNEIEKRRSQTT